MSISPLHLKFDFSPFSSPAGRSEASKSAQTVNTIAMGALLGLAAVTAAVAVFTTLPWTIGLGVIGLVALGALGMNGYYARKHSQEVWHRVDRGSIDRVADFLVRAVSEGNQRVYNQAFHKLKNQLITSRDPFNDANQAALHLKRLGDAELFQFLQFLAGRIDRLQDEQSKTRASIVYLVLFTIMFEIKEKDGTKFFERRQDGSNFTISSEIMRSHAQEVPSSMEACLKIRNPDSLRGFPMQTEEAIKREIMRMALYYQASQSIFAIPPDLVPVIPSKTGDDPGDYICKQSLRLDDTMKGVLSTLARSSIEVETLRRWEFKIQTDEIETVGKYNFVVNLGLTDKILQISKEFRYVSKNFKTQIQFTETGCLVEPYEFQLKGISETWSIVSPPPAAPQFQMPAQAAPSLHLPESFIVDYLRWQPSFSIHVEAGERTYQTPQDRILTLEETVSNIDQVLSQS